MKAPGPGTIGSIVLHAGLGALLFVSWPDKPLPPAPTEGIRVSVISDVQVEAAAADNPSEELITEDGATVPPPETEVPPTPEPEPTPPPPTPAPQKKAPTPTPRPPVTRPPTPQPRPPAPAPKREEPSLDFDRLAKRPNEGRTNRRPNTGDAGRGQAPRALGRADISALGRQVRPVFNCDLPGADSVTVQVSVRLSPSGAIVGTPRLIGPRSDPAYRAISEAVLRGIRAAAPFDMPAGYEEQDITFGFNSASQC
ncbi:MAG: TonB C-terminal domain-containing protein [Caulobacteraceae bacterium]|nr:TonB C-terminal domain-containing protein [Caulobacteraceae bacterium]